MSINLTKRARLTTTEQASILDEASLRISPDNRSRFIVRDTLRAVILGRAAGEDAAPALCLAAVATAHPDLRDGSTLEEHLGNIMALAARLDVYDTHRELTYTSARTLDARHHGATLETVTFWATQVSIAYRAREVIAAEAA